MSTRGDILRRAAQVEPDAVPEPWRPSDDEDALATVSDREHYRKNLVTLPDGAGEVPAYVWDFSRTPTIPNDVREEWTRGSAGRVLGPNGKYVSKGSDVPRLSYDGEDPGLLVEAAGRTNHVSYSSDFTQWQINAGSLSSASSIIKGETAQLLSELGGSGLMVRPSGTFSSGGETVLWIVEKGTSDVPRFYLKNTTAGTFVFGVEYKWSTDSFTVTNNSLLESHSRILTQSGPNGGKVAALVFRVGSGNSNKQSGDSRRIEAESDNAENGDDTIFHHAQLEEALNASSPIVTGGSPVTRAGDDYAIFEGGQPEWWNSNEGTIFCQFSINNATIANGQEALIANGTFSSEWLLIDDRFDPFRLTIRNNANDIKVRITNHGARGLDTIKFASSALPGEVRASANGVSGKQTGDISNLLSLSDLRIGTLGRYAFAIDRIIYYPRALPESTLNRITS